MENGFFSNTIVLKMRPKYPESQEWNDIKIYSELDGRVYEDVYHVIEIFKENGRYKVFDILNRDKTIWLEEYLNETCRVNKCEREQLRYDLGYLAPCHVLAQNMQELSDLMRYLDKEYKIGKPRSNFINISNMDDDEVFLSDDVIMNFDEIGRKFGVTGKEVMMVYRNIYDDMMKVRFNILHLLCFARIMRESIMILGMMEQLFNDEVICELIEKC